jgi:predicted dehydrogenase/nucleoside-diphosphate-sugar epimerase
MTEVAPPPSPAGAVPGHPASESSPVALRRVGFVGAGYIAEWHAKAIASVAGAKLVAVCDKLLSRARAFAETFGVAGVHDSLEAMLASERLDAVHVLLPPDLHFEATRAALEAGRHVLLEKPMCTSVADCEALVRLAEATGLTLGVGHNFLFSGPYELLRRDVREGVLGHVDHVTIAWNRELPQAVHGPFDAWMLRDPGNIMLEIGSHSVAHLLDLVGPPDQVRAQASNPVELPTGGRFYRRWQVDASKGPTAVDLRFSFAPGFGEHTIHVGGTLGSATVDFLRNTYVLRRHHPLDEDLDRFAMARDEARSLRRHARRTLLDYVLSKFHLVERGSSYGASIAKAMDAFYAGIGGALDERVSGHAGTEVIRICEQIGQAVGIVPETTSKPSSPTPSPAYATEAPSPRILVLGATGFIGQELVRQLARSGHAVRILARSPGKLPADLRIPRVECLRGDLTIDVDLRQAMRGIACVYHLAKPSARSWADYQRFEVDVTRQVAEAALAAGVKRFVYTGTIASYYSGARAGTITERTPLDPRIKRRDHYSRAKAASEAILVQMHRERGLPVVILRPGIVIGRGGSPFHWGVGMWWHDSVCQTWGSGDNKLPLVLVEDVAKGLVAALDAPGIEGESFNLVADPCLSAGDYLDELERFGGIRIQRHATPILHFYLWDMLKWVVKTLVRHPERRFPSYRDWESRSHCAQFDCSRTKARLGWRPVSDRDELVRRGIQEPLEDALR